MAIDIASMNAGQKLAYAQAVGQVLLSSQTISSPVAGIDMALPASYPFFRLEIGGLAFSDADNLAIALSSDGGTSFLNDLEEFDSYQMAEVGAQPTIGTPLFADSLLLLNATQEPAGAIPGLTTIWLYPGGASTLAQVLALMGAWGGSPTPFRTLHFGFSGVNIEAEVTPTPVRMNYARIQPYGFSDCNPPTSGYTFTGGTFRLYGCG